MGGVGERGVRRISEVSYSAIVEVVGEEGADTRVMVSRVAVELKSPNFGRGGGF